MELRRANSPRLPSLIPSQSDNVVTLPKGVLTHQELGLYRRPQHQQFPAPTTFITISAPQLRGASFLARGVRKKRRGRSVSAAGDIDPCHSCLLRMSDRITRARFLVKHRRRSEHSSSLFRLTAEVLLTEHHSRR